MLLGSIGSCTRLKRTINFSMPPPPPPPPEIRPISTMPILKRQNPKKQHYKIPTDKAVH